MIGWIITSIICLTILGVFTFFSKKVNSAKKILLNNLHTEYDNFISIFSIQDRYGHIKTYNNKSLISKDFIEYIYDTGSYTINYKWVSGLLTGLGIFGTFLGITVGLIYTPQIDNIQETQNFISTLLGGMRTAFITSLFGIGFSLVFSSIHETVNKKIDTSLENQYKLFLSKWIVEKAEFYLRDQSNNMEELKEITNTFSEASKKMNSVLNSEELGKVISESLTQVIQQQLRPSFDSIAETSKDLKKTNEGLAVYIQNDLPKIFTSLESALNSANTAITSTNQVITETNRSMELTRAMLEKQNENFASLDNLLTNYVTRLETVLKTQSDLFVEQMKKIAGTAIKLLNTTEEKVTKAIDESNQKMKDTMDGLNKILQEQNNRFQETSNASIQLLKDTGEQVRRTIEESNSTIKDTMNNLNVILYDQDKRFKETAQASISLLNTTGEQVRNTIDTSNQNIQSTLKGVNDALVQTSARVQDELSKFREEYAKSLDSYIEKQKEVLKETLTKHTEKLKDVALSLGNELEKDYQRRKEISKDTLDTIQSIKEVMELQKVVDSSVREHLHSLVEKTIHVYKAGNELVEKTIETYKHGNEENKKLLVSMNETHKETIEKMNQSNQDMLIKFDEVLKNKYKDLNKYTEEQSQYMSKIIGYFSSIVESIQVKSVNYDHD